MPLKLPDEPETPDDATLSTPRNTNTANNNETEKPPTTPITGKASATATSKRTPAAAAAATRQRSSSNRRQQEPPSLLTDFLLGRPSPQRMAAQRQRRQSLDAVKSEMRQAAVRKLEQPGSVRDRVKQWQKKNAVAMSQGDPAATPSEPTDIASFAGETESVTEEDRVRIKLRQKKRPASKPIVHQESQVSNKEKANGQHEPSKDESTDKKEDVHVSPNTSSVRPRRRDPPPKRVVSDTNWMAKKTKKHSPMSRPPLKNPKHTGKSRTPISKDFLQRTAVNPPVSKKVEEWAAKLEAPEPRRATLRRTTTSEDVGDGIRIRPVNDLQDDKSISTSKTSFLRDTPSDYDDVRVNRAREKGSGENCIRMKPVDHLSVKDDASALPRLGSSVTSNSCGGDDDLSAAPQQEEPSRVEPVTGHGVSESESITTLEEVDSDRDEAMEESGYALDNRLSRRKPRQPSRREPHDGRARVDDASEDQSSAISSDESAVMIAPGRSELTSSILTSAVGAKSLADIPVGYSAFSELDLPAGPKGSKRFRAQRNPSLRTVPNVLKKVVTGSKKILQDAVEAPKPVAANSPPSIETWLNNTIDPFVEKSDAPRIPASKRSPRERERPRDGKPRRQRSAEREHPASSPPARTELPGDKADSVTDMTETTASSEATAAYPRPTGTATPAKTPTTAGLKRRSATRATSSPLKSASKKPFKEVLKEAFTGESEAVKFSPRRYPSYETRAEPSHDSCSDDNYPAMPRNHLSSSGSSGSWTREPPSPPPDERRFTAAGLRRRPPTNGMRELSTIIGSVAGYSSQESSDMTSHVSDTTVTQSTALTKDSDAPRRRSQNSTSGLKRRLTKHSDLVSVLSLPDDDHVPQVLKHVKSRPSLRGARFRSNSVGVDDLLQEFVDDENLYQRELKTLVDGVVPVLLTTVLQGDTKVLAALFWPYSSSGEKMESLAKAVVNMGVALEKLKNAHRRAPQSNVDRLIQWMQEVVPLYDRYLDAWRLGFQDLIVNLLPAAGRLDDEDSLIGALPRNEDGDIVNENGERVDVAHLLKRPLLRVKLLARWAKVRCSAPSIL